MQKLALVCAAVVLSAECALAQGGGNAALSGTVTDPTGAVIARANVTLTQAGTEVKRTGVTNEAGQFNIPALPPATYRVSVEAAAFKTYVQDVTLLADESGALQIQMQLGAAAETVTVEGTATLVNTVTPVLSQVIERSRVVELPLNGRNAADLTTLVAGAVSSNNSAGTTQGDTKQVPGAEQISVNGARPDEVSYNLDGGSNQDLMSNTNNPFPFPDALQEFSVQTNSFDTQYGTNAGAVVNVVTKSGTNNWHGDVFEFVRNRAFNARNYFAAARDPLKRNQFGATVGGPIKKDSAFIFFGYQGTRIRTQGNANNTILPTPANMTGDFSNYLTANPAVNPQGKVIQINDPTTGNPFPNNQIPVSPVALALTKYLPLSQALPNGRITYGVPTVQNFDEYVTRFDKVVRGTDKLYARFYLDRYVHQPGYDGKNLLTDVPGSTVQTQNWAAGYTWVKGPTFVNNFVADVVRAASERGQGGNVPQFNDFGANVPQLPKAQGGIRGFGITNSYFGLGNFTNGRFIRNTGELRDQAVWSLGQHTVSFGGNYERDQSNVRNTDFENGNWQFSDVLTNLGLAGFVMGHMHAYSQTSGNFSDSRQNVIGLFVEDKWKPRSNLSITLGLRWEPQYVMKEIFGRIEQFRPDMYYAGVRSKIIPTAPAGLVFPGDSYNGVTMPATGQGPDVANFAPRAGIAWDVLGNGKTVVRSGGGAFYSSRLPGLFLNDASISQPFSLRTDLTEPSTPNSLIPFANPLQSEPAFAAQFPLRYTLATIPPGGVPFTGGVSVFGLEPGKAWVTPTTYDWNLTVERQLLSDTLVDFSYVGLRGVHLRQDVYLNPRAAGVGTDASRPYQGFIDIYQNHDTGMSNYNAFQVNVQKRPGGGRGPLKNLTLLANYTFSKAMEIALASNGGITDVGSSKGSGMPFGNPNQGHFDTGPAPGQDRTHRFVASYVWDLPRLTGANGVVRTVLGGWQWTGIFTYMTGEAMTILAGTDRSETALGSDRANFIGDVSQYGKTAPAGSRSGCGSATCVPWLNTSLFALPAIGTFGNIGKGAFRGPGRFNVDTGILKNFFPFKSHEDLRFQLRGEFFNVLNHTQFNDPDVTRNDGNFGGIYGAADPRIIQVAAKFFF
ncbi:MAG TPA: carboxypeptidase regulatory-like domain-containing protein [Bryobacteraceae bacterium]|nr:carboxypeptidase regulatory-like domain-containing protein [Bryobacteraceae bacterium]